jgi:trimeric autotransporter adhesin
LYGGSCGITTAADVWYSFVAQSTNPTIVFTNNGIPRNSTNRAVIQLLSGDCSTLASVSCASRNDAFGTAYNHTTSGLTIGQRYYIRIFSNQATVPTSAWTFTLCVRDAASSYAMVTAKSYVNITKSNGGGSIDVGDVLEIRATISISGTSGVTPVDSLSFHDTLKAGAGFSLQAGTLAMRTNEGKIYGSTFTEAAGDDAGFATGAGPGTDTIIRLNFGAGANSSQGGSVTVSTGSPTPTYPKTAAHNYLIMATYRVVVNQAEGTRINFGGGSFRYRDRTTGAFNVISFARDSLIVYASPDVCPNAVSATNVIGDEFNGTFGTATGTNQHNRVPSANTNYGFLNFTASSPNDNYYGITNNTAAVGTVTDKNLAIPAAAGNRVFSVWDISGDHTGAVDEARGNPPCDATQPVSPTNPCGYMMVFNAAYKTDTAFQFNVANACPNTFYEVSAWFKNVCYKCGQDSIGRGQWSGASYIPTAANDTAGVRPNIAVKVNNLDYYNTGDIQHQATGVARMSSTADSANRWVKRAFVYKTDASTTNFTLTLRNNAPGGGGNDWAIDDISFKTCSPTMQMTPNASQTFCANSQVDMRVYIESYYNMYQYYEWERSTDGGNTWGPAPELTGSQTFSYTNMGNTYRDTVAYPSIVASSTTNGYRYRIRVATTASGLSNSCAVFNTDDVIVVNLAGSGCAVLPAELLKFNVELNGDKSLLTWKAKDESLRGYEVERSVDGVHFSYIGFVSAKGINGNETSYLFNDPVPVSGKIYYRLKMLSFATENNKYSNTLSVTLNPDHRFEIANLVNPFISTVNFQLNAYRNEVVELLLTDALGQPVVNKKLTVNKGANAVSFNVPQTLARGSYLLRVISPSGAVQKIIQKQ